MQKRPMLAMGILGVVVFAIMCGYVRTMVTPPGQDDLVTMEVAEIPESDGDQGMTLRRLVYPGKDDVLVRYSLTHVTLFPGDRVAGHDVAAPQVYYFLEGTGVMTVANESMAVEPGQTVYVPAESSRSLRNTGQAQLCFLAIDDPDAGSVFTSAGQSALAR
ncbi:MAG: cupin domain-containing protein [Desulfovibrio sp.]|nr:MAG: cupin domain-containing protein [Desulfovibrio sp.]